MAELTTFYYRPGRSILHKLDARFKLIFVILISLASLWAGLTALAILSAVFALLILNIRLPVKSSLKELRYFFVLVMFVFLARALAASGSPVFKIAFISVSPQGLYEGLLIGWRLVLIAMLGLFLISTTRSSEIKAAVEWFLIPFGFIPGQRVATMMGLIMRFIPLVFDQARMTIEAQKARGVENRKNPFYRLIKLIIPLLRRIFENADNLALAMQARCYNENRTPSRLSSSRVDWLALIMVVSLSILMVEL
ncbi:MAG: energy-coupling factor transporter transmembrane protein EcfT [Deltaproteobacteria bacterium]|nr:energy-coupling factor transporter transmembrane protein EcfT [Deltaproteobacteria bacterium]MBW2086000.1 energy-coupling factor transporter transmembrane protein EcfT [Deltaproteobacteria bacterium]